METIVQNVLQAQFLIQFLKNAIMFVAQMVSITIEKTNASVYKAMVSMMMFVVPAQLAISFKTTIV